MGLGSLGRLMRCAFVRSARLMFRWPQRRLHRTVFVCGKSVSEQSLPRYDIIDAAPIAESTVLVYLQLAPYYQFS